MQIIIGAGTYVASLLTAYGLGIATVAVLFAVVKYKNKK